LWLLEKTARDITALSSNLELISYGLIIILGAYLSFAAARKLYNTWHAHHGSAIASENTHAQHHSHCGHNHAPLAVAGAGWRANMATVASISIRPCSGAILVLIFTFRWGFRKPASLPSLPC
jgi:nickel/cobalt exporter